MSKTIYQVLDRVMAKDLKGKNGRMSVANEDLGGIIMVANSLLKAANKAEKANDLVKETSLSQVTEAANLEPRIIIEESLKTHPMMGQFMMTLSNIFMGYYLQALQLTANVEAATPMGVLERLNPNRSGDTLIYTKAKGKLGMEEHQVMLSTGYVLPNFKKPATRFVALEAFDPVDAGFAMFYKGMGRYIDELEKEGETSPERIAKLRQDLKEMSDTNRQMANAKDDQLLARRLLDQQLELVEKAKESMAKVSEDSRQKVIELSRTEKQITEVNSKLRNIKDTPENQEMINQLKEELRQNEDKAQVLRENIETQRGLYDGLTKSLDERRKQVEQMQKDFVNAPIVDSQAVRTALKGLNEANNLAIGRWIEVTMSLQGRQVTVPVAVRMRPMFAATIIMRELVAYGDIKESWNERWARFKSGELSFKDWLLQSDRIRHQKKLVALDKNGVLMDMIKRRSQNFKAALASGQPSLGGASAMFIVSKETMDYVQALTGHNFDNAEIRELFFAANSAMVVVVIDDRWDRVTIYTRGVSVGSDYSTKDFAKFGKGDGPDIMEIFKAYQMGSAPRF